MTSQFNSVHNNRTNYVSDLTEHDIDELIFTVDLRAQSIYGVKLQTREGECLEESPIVTEGIRFGRERIARLELEQATAKLWLEHNK